MKVTCKLYLCDAHANKKCSKSSCFIHNGPCHCTINKKYALKSEKNRPIYGVSMILDKKQIIKFQRFYKKELFILRLIDYYNRHIFLVGSKWRLKVLKGFENILNVDEESLIRKMKGPDYEY